MWVTARYDALFKSPNVTKTINIFLAHFRFFEKAPNIFNATGHHACTHTPTEISIDILLSAAKTFGPKISVAYVSKWFQPTFTVGGWRMHRPFNLRLLAPAYKPTESCKRASFWSLNPARARNHKAKPGSSPTFIFEPHLGQAKFTKEVTICATPEQQKTLFESVVAGTRFITFKITTTLTKTLA